MKALSLALILTPLLVTLPASAEVMPSVQYVATDLDCRFEATLFEADLLDTSPRQRALHIVTMTTGIDRERLAVRPTCGTYDAHIACRDVEGSVTDGILCRWRHDDHWDRVSFSGTHSAEAGTYEVRIQYQGMSIPATAFVRGP